MCSVSQPYPTLCNPMDYSLPGSSVHAIFQARILEWVGISSSRGSPWPRKISWDASLASLAWAGGFFATIATWDAQVNVLWLNPKSFLTVSGQCFLTLQWVVNPSYSNSQWTFSWSAIPAVLERLLLLKGNRHESEQTPGDSEEQGSWACCRPWSHKKSGRT